MNDNCGMNHHDYAVTVDLNARKRHQHSVMAESDMADEPEDPDAAADRLETALERIARLTSARPQGQVPDSPDDTLSVPEIAERLDHLIGRLRAALEQHSGDFDEAATKAD